MSENMKCILEKCVVVTASFLYYRQSISFVRCLVYQIRRRCSYLRIYICHSYIYDMAAFSCKLFQPLHSGGRDSDTEHSSFLVGFLLSGPFAWTEGEAANFEGLCFVVLLLYEELVSSPPLFREEASVKGEQIGRESFVSDVAFCWSMIRTCLSATRHRPLAGSILWWQNALCQLHRGTQLNVVHSRSSGRLSKRNGQLC